MPDASVMWGCAAAVVSSAIQSLGITLQRKSHIIPYNHELSNESVVNLRRDSNAFLSQNAPRKTHNNRRNLWLVGFLLFIVANVFGSLVQLTTLPLIILSPLQSIGLIFNSVFSCTLLPGEHCTRKLVGGTVVIATGAFVIAYNGATSKPPPSDINADERFRLLLERFLKPGFLAWWCFTFLFMAVLLRVIWSLSARVKLLQLKQYRRQRRPSRSARDPTSRLLFMKGILYGVVSGTLTAHTFLFAKSIVDVCVEMVVKRSAPKSSSTYAISIALLLLTLCIVGTQLAAFNLGLSNISTSILYPLCFLVYNLVNLFNDLFFNRLLSEGGMTVRQFLYVLLGLSGVLYGVVLISWDSACEKFEQSTEGDQSLLEAKFPYGQTVGENRLLSYEENELMSSFSDASCTIEISSL
ncbi:hypothetical protein OXX59_007216 [Metschnikowia pulcherrima]